MRHTLFGVRIDDLEKNVVQTRLHEWLAGDRPRAIVTPNAEFLLQARKDPFFAGLLNRADLSVPDSVSLRYAVAALSTANLLFRYPGVDLLLDLIKASSVKNKRVMLIGGSAGSAEKAAAELRKKHPGLQVSAHDPGQISITNQSIKIPTKTQQLIEQERPDVIAVGLGQLKQELFMDALKKRFPSTKVLIGVGGSFEMISGAKQRSPLWMRQTGLEWLWRLFIEPQRLQRIANASIVFPVIVAKEAFQSRGVTPSLKSVFSEVIKQLRGL